MSVISAGGSCYANSLSAAQAATAAASAAGVLGLAGLWVAIAAVRRREEDAKQ